MPEHSRRFISCDWGTTNLRLRLIGFAERKEFATDEGTAKLAGAAGTSGDRAALFRATLQRGLDQLGAPAAPADLPVIISGMASSSIGWKELPYAGLPFALEGRDAVRHEIEPGIHLISGLRSNTDVMRGEETEAIGLAAALGNQLPARVVFVLPGTHCKHLEIENGLITSFRTYMTGELFQVLTRHSVLRHSTDPDAAFDRRPFVEGVEESQGQPLTSALFRVRTRQVLDQHGACANGSFLSGLLIGVELAGLKDVDRPIIVAAGEQLREMYRTAGDALHFGSRLTTMTSDGLAALGQEALLRRSQ